MSNAVGKAREHELWKRLQEERKSRANVVIKRESDDELKQRIQALLRHNREIPETQLGSALRLPYVQQFRLRDILGDLIRTGKIAVKTGQSTRVLYLRKSMP